MARLGPARRGADEQERLGGVGPGEAGLGSVWQGQRSRRRFDPPPTAKTINNNEAIINFSYKPMAKSKPDQPGYLNDPRAIHFLNLICDHLQSLELAPFVTTESPRCAELTTPIALLDTRLS